MIVDHKHQKFDKRMKTIEGGFIYKVTVPWAGQPNFWWNEACASVVEVFGLPGNRFTSHPRMDQMDFYFKSEKDADLCRILLSESI